MDQSPAQRSFTVDTKAPKVNSVLPTEDATGVGQAVNVQATFSEAMSASSITPIAAVVGYDTGTKTVMLNPDIELQLATKYKAVVTTGTEDLAGNRLDQDPDNGHQRQVWTFTTASN